MNSVWKKRIQLIAKTLLVICLLFGFSKNTYAVDQNRIDDFFKASSASQAFDIISELQAKDDQSSLQALKAQIQEKAVFNELGEPQKQAALTAGQTSSIEFPNLSSTETQRVKNAFNAFKTGNGAAQSLIQGLTSKEKSALAILNVTEANSQIAQAYNPAENVRCTLDTNFSPTNCIKLMLATILNVVIYLFGYLLSIAAYLFDFAYDISVTNFAKLVDPKSGLGAAIVSIWIISRDLSNMFFIFILTASGVGTMLGYEKLNIKKNLSSVLTIALLINFSMPIARAVIDINNLLAHEFYQKVQPANGCTIASFITNKLSVNTTGGVADYLNFTKICNGGGAPKEAPIGKVDTLAMIGSMIGAWFIITTAAFTFLLGAFFLLYRTVALLFVLAFGPLAFLSSLVPRVSKYYGTWWNELFNQSLFAPVYLFLLYFVFRILEGVGGPAQFLQGVTGFTNPSFQLAVYYFFIFTLLNGATTIAKDLSGDAADFAKGWSNWTMSYIKTPYTKAGGALRSGASSFASGVANRAGRATIGRITERAGESATLRDFASGSGTTIAGRVGRLVNTVAGPQAASSIRSGIQEVGNKNFGQSEEAKEAQARLAEFKGDPQRQLALLTQLNAAGNRVSAQKAYDSLSAEEKIKIEEKAQANPTDASFISYLRTEHERDKKKGFEIDPATGKPFASQGKQKELDKAQKTVTKENVLDKLLGGGKYVPGTGPASGSTPAGEQKSLQKMNNEEIGKILGKASKADLKNFASILNDLEISQFKRFILNIPNNDNVDQDTIDTIAKIYGNAFGGSPDEALKADHASPFLDPPTTPGLINQARQILGLS